MFYSWRLEKTSAGVELVQDWGQVNRYICQPSMSHVEEMFHKALLTVTLITSVWPSQL